MSAALLAAASWWAGAPAAAAQQPAIHGTVRAAEQPQRLAAARVSLEGGGADDPVRLEAVTDANGAFAFRDVPPGEYLVTAATLGRLPQTIAATVEEGRPARVLFELGVAAVSLDELVVTGTVRPTAVKELPSPVTIVDAGDIERLSPRNVGEIIKLAVPGAVYSEGGPGARHATFSVRGVSSLASAVGGQTTLKIYVDGIEVADPSYIINIDPGVIERIEVVSGPQASTIYGSRAISGVMQIFTKRGSGESWRQPRLSGAVEIEMVESPHVQEIPRSPKYRLTLSGGDPVFGYNFGFSGRQEPEWVELLTMTDQAFFGSVNFMVKDRLEVDLSSRVQDGYNEASWNPIFRRLYSSIGFPDRPPDRQSFTTHFETHSISVGLDATSWWSHEFQAGADRHRDFVHDAVPDPNGKYTVRLRDTDRWTIAYNTTLRKSFGSSVAGTLVAGLDHGEYTSVGHDAVEVADWRDYEAPVDGIGLVQHTDGYFAQAQLGLPGGLHFTSGLRGDLHPHGSANPLTWSPRFGLAAVREFGALTVKPRIAWGQAVIIPNNIQVGGRELTYAVIKANPGLRAQKQRGYDAGLDVVYPGRGSLAVTFFDQDPIDMIELLVTPERDLAGPFPRTVLQYQNISRANNRGWEVRVEAQPWPMLALNVNYGRTRTVIGEIGPGYTGSYESGETLDRTPGWTAAVGASLTPWEGTSLSADLTHLSDWREADVVQFFGDFLTGKADPARKPYPKAYLVPYPGVTKLNLSFTQALPGGISAFVHVYNLTSEDRFERINIQLPRPRTWTLGFRY